ncbi:MAG: bifunctional DNA-formamidopyrimidine glycosylase/DNA-(apurinic or apyrimidinic site) lyase [Phycisphaerales bacterium]|nr:MAG: bifunctional DNA-formamidopyrimidine glycosylase/DNA-(apurinic or apyrimidinic site) lyase [Phycisphaerales bacterium]
MPELPEAETIARQLHDAMAGCTLGDVIVTRRDIVHGDPRPLGRVLPDRRVRQVRRRAKRVVLELDPEAQLVFALGMTGRLTVNQSRTNRDKHTHLRISIRGTDRELRFCDPRRFGGVWCLAEGAKHKGRRLSDVGPEPLELTPAHFRRLISRSRQIKTLLMDQHMIAGLGNIYCDESLHAAGVHPLTKADTLDRDAAERLLRAIKRILKRAIREQGSTVSDYQTTSGTSGSFQNHHRVYQKEGRPCRTCSTPIERITAAGRSTFFCPSCQQIS